MDPGKGQRKRRTREHVIADLSINHVERFIFRAGYTSLRETHDYGIDLFVKTFDAQGFLEPGYLLMQVKASDQPPYVGRAGDISVTIDHRDLSVWAVERYPVFLIFYDASRDRASSLHVQRYAMESGGTERLAMSAYRNFRIPG